MGKRILICDDDADLRKALVLLLSPDYQLVEARDGKEALRAVDAEALDLVFLDVSMPEMTGLQTLKVLHQTHPALPTIMLTGKTEIGIARRALGLGAIEYISKPFDPDYVKSEVRRLLDPPPAKSDGDDGRPPWRVAATRRS